MASKALAGLHFQKQHVEELQAFKRQKLPALFQALPKLGQEKAAVSKISFAREDILKKRPVDDAVSFGGWAKKEKPELPPCERPENQQPDEPVLTAPPWMNASKPVDTEATQMDKEVDGHVVQAQIKRFSKRNVLEVNPTSARCKLCFKVIGTSTECEKHIAETHKEDFEKELQMWERFLFTVCKRQPPFGWVCKVCNQFFPSDAMTWRHLGKEVFLRREERHMTQWHEKEDRWGHEEDAECCGDGMSFGQGFSFDSIRRFNEEARQQNDLREAREIESIGPANKPSTNEEEEDEEPAEPTDVGEVKFIREF